MNLSRKILRMVDLRVHHYLAGANASSRLHRVHSIESLASEHVEFKAVCQGEKTAKNSS